YGYSEAEKVLRVGLNLRELLLTTTDIDTVYISRTNDNMVVSLTQRTDEANSLAAAWYHSIHSDAGGPDANSTLLLWGQYRDGREKIPNGGKSMSAIMVDLLTRGYRTGTRGSIGDCSFYGCTSNGPYLHVNRQSTMPSELSEAGFHTNPTQNQRNMNAEWKRLEAKTFYWTFLKHHGLARPPVGTYVGFVTDLESGVPINGAKITLNGQTYTTDTYQSLFYKYSSDPNLLHNGFFYFENLPLDTLELIISAPGYFVDTTRVVVSDSFFTFQDPVIVSTAAPFVQTTTPAQGDTNLAAWADVIINFSRRMERATVEPAITLTPSSNILYFWSNNNTRLTLRHDSLQIETNYTLRIAGSAQGQFGQLLDGNRDGVGGDDFVLNFRTGPLDMRAPNLLTVYPPNRGNDTDLQPIINMYFDEALSPNSITSNRFELRRNPDNVLAAGALQHYVVNDRSIVCFFPSPALASNTRYNAKLLPGLRDVFGNAISSEKNFTFTTGETGFTATKLDDFEANLTSNWWEPQQSGTTTGIISEQTSRGSNATYVNALTNSTAAMEIKYGWDVSTSEHLMRVFLDGGAPQQVLFDSSYLLQVYVFGDGSGNQFRFAVDDKYPTIAAANHEVSPWFTVNWTGWRLVTWDMTNDGTGAWIGDGSLDGTLRFDSIQLTHMPGKAASGAFYFDDLRIAKKVTVSVAEEEERAPEAFNLAQNYPNPFNPSTAISYRLSAPKQHVSLAIYDLLGQRIRTLVEQVQSAGDYVVQWEGRNDLGQPVTSGSYLYTLKTDSFTETRRMLLLR
ncbi:Ig-like domain-containing protein, partial [candidate division KSB1 bacterium]|nr:Ig-like domain-containing protein [candidate division KSB1 bacterium]